MRLVLKTYVVVEHTHQIHVHVVLLVHVLSSIFDAFCDADDLVVLFVLL